MADRIRTIIDRLSGYFFWIIVSILATLTAFQVHGTLISVALAVIENNSTGILGWNTGTVYAFSRFLWLLLGIVWLGWVMFTLDYLREGQKYQDLRRRLIRLAVILGGIYGFCYLILLFLI